MILTDETNGVRGTAHVQPRGRVSRWAPVASPLPSLPCGRASLCDRMKANGVWAEVTSNYWVELPPLPFCFLLSVLWPWWRAKADCRNRCCNILGRAEPWHRPGVPDTAELGLLPWHGEATVFWGVVSAVQPVSWFILINTESSAITSSFPPLAPHLCIEKIQQREKPTSRVWAGLRPPKFNTYRCLHLFFHYHSPKEPFLDIFFSNQPPSPWNLNTLDILYICAWYVKRVRFFFSQPPRPIPPCQGAYYHRECMLLTPLMITVRRIRYYSKPFSGIQTENSKGHQEILSKNLSEVAVSAPPSCGDH